MSLYQLGAVSVSSLTSSTPIAVIYGGTGTTTSTGTSSVVLSSSPTIVTPTLTSPTLTAPILGTGTFDALTLTGQSGTTFTYGGNNIYSYGITFTPHAGGAQLNLASYGAMNLFTLNTLAMSISTTQVVTFPATVVSPIGDFTTVNSTTINTSTVAASTSVSVAGIVWSSTGINFGSGGTVNAGVVTGNTISSSGLSTNDAVFTNSLQQLVSNPISGSGSVAMTISPVFTTPSLGEAQFADLILNGTTGTTFTYDGMSVYTYGYQMRNEGGGNSAYISSYGNQRFFVQDALQLSIGNNGISTDGSNYFQYTTGTWTPHVFGINPLTSDPLEIGSSYSVSACTWVRLGNMVTVVANFTFNLAAVTSGNWMVTISQLPFFCAEPTGQPTLSLVSVFATYSYLCIDLEPAGTFINFGGSAPYVTAGKEMILSNGGSIAGGSGILAAPLISQTNQRICCTFTYFCTP